MQRATYFRLCFLRRAAADALACKALSAIRPPADLQAAVLAAEPEYVVAVAVGAVAFEPQLAWAHQGIATGPRVSPATASGSRPRLGQGRPAARLVAISIALAIGAMLASEWLARRAGKWVGGA